MAPSRPDLLPVRFAPRHDETFSSWLVRLAAAHELKTSSFCTLVTGVKAEFNRDLDGATADRFLPALCRRTGFSPERLRVEHTLVGFNGRLYREARSNAATAWILPLGRTTSRRPASQFCALCLSEEIPYFRRIWRLSLFAVCPSHGCGLQHLCPQCGAVVDPLKDGGRSRTPKLAFCWRCDHDLRSVPVVSSTEVEYDTAREFARAIHEGLVPTQGPAGIGLNEYFYALATLCARLISKRARLRPWRELAAKGAGVELPPPLESSHSTTAFDTLADPKLRSPVLRVASWLLQRWPERFLEVARAAGTRTSDFTGVFYQPPPWFLEPLRTRLTPVHHAPPPTAGIVRAASKREFVLARRDEWSIKKQGGIVRALRRAGFYSPMTNDEDILRWLRRCIASLRVKGCNYRLDATCRVARGTPQWRRLRRLARPYYKDRCSTPEQLQRGIALLCRDVYLSAHDLSELLERCREVLKAKHLTPMVRAGQLETRFGQNATGRRNHPQQAYRSIDPDPSAW